MKQDWTEKPDAQRALALQDDPRPAWLWAEGGKSLLWHNDAAALFGAKLKSSGLKRAEAAQPIKGQITRILRLGLMGQSTLSRMQFVAGSKPLSATCVCTPLALADAGGPALLVVGVDPIAEEIRAAAAPAPEDVAGDEPEAIPDDAVSAPDEPEAPRETPEETAVDAPGSGLSALVAKLADDGALYEPLSEADDLPLPPEAIHEHQSAPLPQHTGAPEATDGEQSDWGAEAVIDETEVFTADAEQDASGRAGLWQITGRGLTLPTAHYETDTSDEGEQADESAPENDDRAARYNFEELARILNDRIGTESEPEAPAEPAPEAPRDTGSLVPLSDESLVLNRLPLGILIFRDQEILFANRALVDLTGYENATTLRALGLATIFPTVDAAEPAGPVTQLVRRDGEKIAVTARLQTVSWQGRNAVMLSARARDGDVLDEGEVKRFAQLAASLSGDIFLATDANGVVSEVSINDGGEDAPAPGMTLTALIAPEGRAELERFLSLPARFAESRRPAVTLKGSARGTRLKLFAQGRAGVISGYFGILEMPETPGSPAHAGVPTATLSRISREVRRPLNTISGFAELIASQAFGPITNPRYIEYARDIKAAGQAIGDLADELDDFVRLANGEMRLSPADIDLATLLADCLVRVRGHAGSARVLLRSAISEALPFVRADEATLKQAVLNMLASAIAQSGEGSKVVLSAQREGDGSVSIHVRDAAKSPNALTEQFVVFRDGQDKEGAARAPIRSSIGLTLTRSLAAVNACSLDLAPASETGTLMTLSIPAALVIRQPASS
ncbi:sensor histidine kinase [Pelagibacterium xiamenense]|uniref:sensor histidine kinase n=1 Tax=Pelagibacterium xiamenense TaxID=2901140 RepID=UPI001E2F6872|nr:HAMP domain-containing sensor histidine kinase [Pelagibacterium xiamenense]MCD7059193.1 HAMP domain-containing histidine kinase [Pelagibacterium xiamenense]